MRTIGAGRRTAGARATGALLAMLAAITLTAWGCGGDSQPESRSEEVRAEQGRTDAGRSAYATVRRYEGVTDPTEAGRRVAEGFIPIVSGIPGFVAYYWVDAGNGVMVSTSVFRDAAGAERSNVAAADWVRDNLAPLLPNPPQITAGQVVAHGAG